MASNPKRPGVADVARIAGVHPSTVSRALSPIDRRRISADVVERVISAASALGYQPDGVAAGLRSGRTRLVGVVLPDIANTVFAPILCGIEAGLEAEGLIAIVASTRGDAKRQQILCDRLAAQRVCGIILATASRADSSLATMAARGMPLVLVNRSISDSSIPSVVSDDAVGMSLAVEHLASLGHRRLVHIAGPLAVSTGFGRKAGFLAAVEARGLERPFVSLASGYDRGAGHAATIKFLNDGHDVTAIVCANDLIALGCIDALRERRLECAAKMSVVGHNDMPLVDITSPPLTTIRIRHHEMGLEAARLMLLAIEGQRAPMSVVLRPELIVRASTGAPRR